MNQIIALQHKVLQHSFQQWCKSVFVMTLEILFSNYGLYFSSYRFVCKGKSASYFDILNYFGFCWLADLIGVLVSG